MTIYTMTADGRAWKCDADEMEWVEIFIQAKITSGELRVVKKGKWFQVEGYGAGGIPVTTWVHEDCRVVPAVEVSDENARFCPSCGAEMED